MRATSWVIVSPNLPWLFVASPVGRLMMAPRGELGEAVRTVMPPTVSVNTELARYPPEHRDFARVWQKAEKIVFSPTLTGAPTRIARVARDFDPEATRKPKWESEHDIIIGGAELARRARIRSRRRMSPVSQPGDRRRRKATTTCGHCVYAMLD